MFCGEILHAPTTPTVIAKRIWFWYRCSTYKVCDICGKMYIDHPMETDELSFDGESYLHRVCNGDRVKL